MRLAKPAFLWGVRLLLAYLFLTAAIGGWVWAEDGFVRTEGKLLDPQQFVFHVRAFQLMEDPWNAWAAMGLPWLECLTGIALLLPWTALGGAASATAMLTMFIAALISVRARGLEVNCGCFGGPTAASDLTVAIASRVLWLGLAIACFLLLWQAEKKTTSN